MLGDLIQSEKDLQLFLNTAEITMDAICESYDSFVADPFDGLYETSPIVEGRQKKRSVKKGSKQTLTLEGL